MKAENKTLTTEQCKDSGLALVLISLICYQVWKVQGIFILAIALLLVAMTYPPVFKPFARLWFALSTLLGTVVSRIILTLLFFIMVLPLGYIRGLLGKDAMQTRRWKKDSETVFRSRNHRFSAEDLEHPY